MMFASLIPDVSHPNPVGFFNRRWVQNVLPLATSLGLHLTIILVGVALYQAVKEVSRPNRDQPIIPAMGNVSAPVLPISAHPSSLDLPMPDLTPGGSPDVTELNPSKASQVFPGGLIGDDPSMTSGPSSHSGIRAINPGDKGELPWRGPGGDGNDIIFRIGKEAIPAGNARKVVFLCDASGSMLGVFGELKHQLRETISNLDLTKGEEFNVIFFSDANVFPLFKDGTQIATPDNKKLAFDFIDNAVSTGGTLPVPAIKFAMAEKPDLIYVLTDGFDQIANFDDVTNAFKANNKDGHTHINCIFLQSDEDPKLEAVLKQISNDAHGQFVKILKSDM